MGTKRKNGFQRPFSDLQIITWILYPVILAGFYALVLPMLSDELIVMAVTGGVYFVLHVWSARAAYRTTVCDPADPDVKVHKRYREQAGYAKTDKAGPPRAPLPPLHETCFERVGSTDRASDDEGSEGSEGSSSGGGGDEESKDDEAEWQCRNSAAICWAGVAYMGSCLIRPQPPAEKEVEAESVLSSLSHQSVVAADVAPSAAVRGDPHSKRSHRRRRR